jgi:hypothetical protein
MDQPTMRRSLSDKAAWEQNILDQWDRGTTSVMTAARLGLEQACGEASMRGVGVRVTTEFTEKGWAMTFTPDPEVPFMEIHYNENLWEVK